MFQEGMVRGGILVRRRITTDSPKLKTVVGFGAGICCGKMSNTWVLPPIHGPLCTSWTMH